MTKGISAILLCGVVLLSACSKRERSTSDESEWDDIQPLTNRVVVLDGLSRRVVESGTEDYAPLIRRMEEMLSVERASGETMIVGESLVLDYERRFVRMDRDVKVVDDRGGLETEMLIGRFSESNEVEMVEARKGVRITSEGRTATAESANYAFKSGAIELFGAARVAEGENRLSAERINFWIKGSRRMVCEPNALLEIAGASELDLGGLAQDGDGTEIRSDRLVYDEEKALAVFEGNVRLRDSRVAMNCGKVRLYLKEGSEIDWIEALSEVIIHLGERKALADRASYHADEGKFVLDGNPKVKQGRDIWTGDRITFWQEPQRMLCEPNARILFHLDEETRARFLKDLKD